MNNPVTVTKQGKAELVRAEAFLGEFTSNWDESEMSALEIIEYIKETGELPDDVSIWEPFEGYDVKHLLEEYY